MYKQKRFSRPNRGGNFNRGRYNPKFFDPRKIISQQNNVDDISGEEKQEVIKHEFIDFNVDNRLKQAISRRNYKTPTPIQDKTIPEIINGNDVVGIANTGTGKTAAFLIPLIDKVFKSRSRVLIVAPTRELATQIEAELREFNRQIPSALCIGGVNIRPQIKKLQKNPSFVIGTPGRLLDLFNQRKLNFNLFDTVVLDEVDRMLDMGFVHDIKKIVETLPQNRQSLFFSATLDERTKTVMKSFITDPVVVSVKQRETSANVHQKVLETKGNNKMEILQNILDKREAVKSIVFVRTKRGADKLSKSLFSIGFKTTVMHGNKSQNQRQRSLEHFRSGKADILIATDVASRGIDVNDITHVINFDLPESYEDYIHRIGRTGRSGKKGVAISLV